MREPEEMSFCHCTRCQRWTGGGSTLSVEVEGTNFEITAGQELIKHFTEEGFSGVAFCSNCGSSLYAFGDGKYYVSAGTLPGLKLQPQYHMMVAYKAAWGRDQRRRAAVPGVLAPLNARDAVAPDAGDGVSPVARHATG